MSSSQHTVTPTISTQYDTPDSFNLLRPRRELHMFDDLNSSSDRDAEGQVTISKEEFQRLLKNQEEMLKKQHLLEEKLALECRTRRKIRPSRKVKAVVHTLYKGLVEAGKKWDTTKAFGHQVNIHINSEMKNGLKNQLTEDDAVLQVAMKTYFMTKRKETKRLSTGKMAAFKKKQARRQRKQQKLTRRKENLEKCTSMGDTEKKLVQVLLTNTDYISSEDTDSCWSADSEDDDVCDVAQNRKAKKLRRRPLTWRSNRVQTIFDMLDKRHEKRLQKMGGGFVHTRQDGAPSFRGAPDDAPSWAAL